MKHKPSHMTKYTHNFNRLTGQVLPIEQLVEAHSGMLVLERHTFLYNLLL